MSEEDALRGRGRAVRESPIGAKGSLPGSVDAVANRAGSADEESPRDGVQEAFR